MRNVSLNYWKVSANIIQTNNPKNIRVDINDNEQMQRGKMIKDPYPSLNEFLSAPIEEVAKISPATIAYAQGGTRRRAVFAGISPESAEYPEWTRSRTIDSFDLIFQHGVQHIIAPIITPAQMMETTVGYRDRLLEWVDWGTSGTEAIADYKQKGWRVRILGVDTIPQLMRAAARLNNVTPQEDNSKTLWWLVVPDYDSPWQTLFTDVIRLQIRTRKEAIRTIYGEDIPPATMFLSFGKPQVSLSLIPPLLIENLQCYWKQIPGYDLTKKLLRTIFYDYAYLRNTWLVDKTGRAEAALEQKEIWENGPTIGLGMRLGPFWYPAPTSTIKDNG